MNGKLAVLDISESGGQIGEKLFALIDDKQRQELIQYVLASQWDGNSGIVPYSSPSPPDPQTPPQQLTECRVGELYFCLESRTVCVCNKEIDLTAKEFDILAVLVTNPYRVVSYAIISEEVWNVALDCCVQKTISNHVSRLRRKLQVNPRVPDYIKSVHGVGYRFNIDIL